MKAFLLLLCVSTFWNLTFSATVGVEKRHKDDQELQELKMEVMQLRLQQMKGKFCTVGLEDGRVKNHQIAAVSYWGNGFEPHQARLNAVKQASSYGAWASKYLHVGQWIRVDLQYPTYVTGVVTQGRPLESQQWVTSYKIAYGNTTSALQVLQRYGKDVTFQANRDAETKVANFFPTPVVAKHFWLLVQGWHNHISMRLEYLTCLN